MSSVSGLGIDGLVSGLDTTSLINSLMTAESQPQTDLKAKVTSTQTTITALQTLNTQIASLATLATTTKAPTSLAAFTASSSSTNVTATTGTSASAGSFDLVVGAVAQAKVGVSAAMTSWPAGGSGSTPALTLVDSTGKATDITPASSSIDDIVSAVNSSTAGVKALKVASGTDANGVAQYRIQFSASATGAASDFQVYSGTSSDVTAGTATNILAQSGSAVIKTAQDAQVTLFAGTAAEQTITSATNTFSDLLPGVSVTVSKASSDPVTVTVAQDTTTAGATASALVTGINGVLASIATKSAVVNSTDSAGNKVVSGGPFTGDSTVRDANDAIVSAASMPVDGHSPSEYGISINKDGSFDFDQTKFATALANDPAGTQKMLSTIASRVADAANSSSDKYQGTLTGEITGQQSIVTDLNSQVSQWDLRLTARRAALESQYSTLETQLASLQSQSSSLTSSLAGLPTTYTG
ncbi:flagellar filament capping protein FliD [Frondihabitans cladoniiphilus]|uniref:Flagellar hook-associated protein 2 n=1 Tax=Frondihabitans cladoniiphilus TaxID=715785 RepID=A0ABP8VYH1_9MICO